MSIGILQRAATIVLAITALAGVDAAPGQAQQPTAQFYKNRQISLIIPSTVGGGYDLYGRLVARHIGKYIPGNPNVVPSNMSGAAGVVAAQYAYSSGAKDGTVLAELYPNAIMAPLLGDAGQLKYDSSKFNYIGSVSAETFVCFVRADAPAKSFADALTQEVILGATGVGGPSTDYPALYDNLLGAKFKVIPGYPGITEIGLAIQKGEIEGTCGSSWSTMTTGHPEWLRDGTMRILAQENIASHPDIAKLGVSLSIDFAKTPEARQIIEFVFTQSNFGRPFVMAPEVPAERVEATRSAFSAVLQDPDLLAEAKTMNLEIDAPMTGADLQATVVRLLATTPDIVEKTKQAVILKR
jgi:tripartite-type tricarboxylate transporter receptor subunit TctC